MFVEVGEPHHTPHFHAYYQQHVAVFGIDSIAIIAGSIPLSQKRLIEVWTELHQEELKKCWDLLQHGKLPGKIKPLK